jgi:integrase/recombinase XerD
VKIENQFLKWCKQERYDVEQITYDQCMKYVEYLQNKRTKKGKSLADKSIKQEMGVIKLYFNYLVNDDIRYLNPLESYIYFIDGKTYEHDFLNLEELDELYTCFPTLDISPPKCKFVAIRDKVVIGLAVYQGLDAKSIKALKVEHVDLSNGKIYIPGTIGSNSRKLSLKSCQILILMNYLQIDREELQIKIDNYSEALFPMNSDRMSCILSPLFKKLRTIYSKVKCLKQIRASVITLWVKQYGLRKAQKMAGHRYISSTELYDEKDSETLKRATVDFHPIQ